MANQFSTFIDAFNKRINQKDALKTITTYSTRVADEVFKDSKAHPDSTYPVSKMSKTIKLSLSGTLDSKYEPVGKKAFAFATIDPLYEKLLVMFLLKKRNITKRFFLVVLFLS